jgi:hypothetical protein
MATIPTKITLADEAVSEYIIPEQTITAKTIPGTVIAQKVVSAHTKYANESFKITDLVQNDTISIKVSVNGAAAKEIMTYTVPKIEANHKGDFVINGRFKYSEVIQDNP